VLQKLPFLKLPNVAEGVGGSNDEVCARRSAFKVPRQRPDADMKSCNPWSTSATAP